MSDSATAPREQRRLELRLSRGEYRRLQRQAADNFRSPVGEARRLVIAGLAERNGDKRRAE